jgi:cell shape-determining protein MreC
MFDSVSITRLPDDPQQLQAFFATLPREVVEKFAANWRRRTDSQRRNEAERRIFEAMERRLLWQQALTNEPLAKEIRPGLFFGNISS